MTTEANTICKLFHFLFQIPFDHTKRIGCLFAKSLRFTKCVSVQGKFFQKVLIPSNTINMHLINT